MRASRSRSSTSSATGTPTCPTSHRSAPRATASRAWRAPGCPFPRRRSSARRCTATLAAGGDDARLRMLVSAAVGALQARSGLRLGSARRPLILSVRSGAPASMPGMLETVLDVGLCDESVEGLVALTGNPRLAWDSYRRLVESFARVVAGCPLEPFEQATRCAHGGGRRATSARPRRADAGRAHRRAPGALPRSQRQAVPAEPARSGRGCRAGRAGVLGRAEGA